MPSFFDIEGEIPVSMDVELGDVPSELRRPGAKVGGCMAWDVDPPRPFDRESARRNGTWMSAAAFWPFVSEARALRAKAAP